MASSTVLIEPGLAALYHSMPPRRGEGMSGSRIPRFRPKCLLRTLEIMGNHKLITSRRDDSALLGAGVKTKPACGG